MRHILRGRLADWCNGKIDIVIVTCGVLILAYGESSGYNAKSQALGYDFWTVLTGVIMISVGIAAMLCYRILLRRQHEFKN